MENNFAEKKIESANLINNKIPDSPTNKKESNSRKIFSWPDFSLSPDLIGISGLEKRFSYTPPDLNEKLLREDREKLKEISLEKKILHLAVLVGKTNLLKRMVGLYIENGNSNSEEILEIPSITATLQQQTFKVIFHDTADWYQSETQENENPFRGIDGIFLCYDISNRISFENLDKKWKLFLEKKKALDSAALVITGCKSDLTHVIDPALIKHTKKYADDDVLTSAMNNEGITEAMAMMIGCVMNTRRNITNTKVWKKLVDSQPRNVGESPHQFKMVFFTHPTWCKFCEGFIYGISSKQGYRCEVCKYTSHKRCLKDVPHMCELE